MSTKNQYFPQSVPHPGIDLAEKLEELTMGPKEFAIRTDKPEKTIIAILNGNSSITPDMAVQFENVLKIPAHFWLNRQRNYDEFRAREERQEILQDSIEWAKKFPLKEMLEKNWITVADTIEEKTASLLYFFGLSSHNAWENYYCNQQLKVAFRISLAQTKEPYALSAWLRMGELQALELKCSNYNEKSFKEALLSIKSLMANHPDDFFIKLQSICLNVGVKVVYTPCLPKAPISGSTRWLNDDFPLIQLTGRYKRNDNFWFTFFHEAGHILIHGKKDIFLESIDYSDKDLEKEKEADDFAIKWTFSKSEQEKVMKKNIITENDIIEFAKEFNTHPAMIIGRLQYEKIIPYSVGRQFLAPVEL
jgi:HTH-type transcriptional regulator/antitoxin HigA